MTLVEKAKVIRKILKKEFPQTKFSVRKSSTSTIRINYQNSVPAKLVEKLVSKFEVIDRCPVTHEILLGGNDFVFVERDITEDNRKAITQLVKTQYNYEDMKSWEFESLVHRVISTTDFNKLLTISFDNVGIVGNSHTSL